MNLPVPPGTSPSGRRGTFRVPVTGFDPVRAENLCRRLRPALPRAEVTVVAVSNAAEFGRDGRTVFLVPQGQDFPPRPALLPRVELGEPLAAAPPSGRRIVLPADTPAETLAAVLGLLAESERLRFRVRTLRRRSARRLRLACRDPLTALPNRRGRQRRLKRLPPHRGGLALLDLDGFKALNTRGSHAAGDACLQAFGKLLRTHLRKGDSAARWGGDEFVIHCPRITAAEMQAVLERLRAAWRTTHPAEVGPDRPSFSAGWTLFEATTAVDLRRAEHQAAEALRRAKLAGKDTSVRFTE